MSMNISSDFRNAPIENTNESIGMQSITPAPNQAVHSASDSVSDHTAAQQPGANSPTDGGRETTTNGTPGYAEIERMTEERLAGDPDYQELKTKYETWKNIENDFGLIDQHTGFITGDGTVTLDNLRALSGDSCADPGARAAANRLLDCMQVWNELAKGDNQVGTHDVTEFVTRMKDQLKAMKESVRADIKTENGVPTPGSSAGGAAAAADASSSTATEGSSQLFKASAPSTKPGMEGAVENINNALQSIGNEMGDVMAKMTDPKTPPEERQKLQAKYNDLQQLQSMLTAMYTQLQEAISHLMKMYSDVAKNSIQNMR